MPNGNLKDYFSDRRTNTLTWEMRLNITIDAAQAMESVLSNRELSHSASRRQFTSLSDQEGRQMDIKKWHFSHSEILHITNNFQTTIGKGGFGIVYQGQMEDGTQEVVKTQSKSLAEGLLEFQTEAELLMTVHHRNLVSFVGFCDEGSHKSLINEFMPNGSLKDYISGRKSHTLTWEKRLNIVIDTAKGLEYLHRGCKPPIIHRC